MIVVALLTLLAVVGAEPARGILAQRYGQCHLPNLSTGVFPPIRDARHRAP